MGRSYGTTKGILWLLWGGTWRLMWCSWISTNLFCIFMCVCDGQSTLEKFPGASSHNPLSHDPGQCLLQPGGLCKDWAPLGDTCLQDHLECLSSYPCTADTPYRWFKVIGTGTLNSCCCHSAAPKGFQGQECFLSSIWPQPWMWSSGKVFFCCCLSVPPSGLH
jgi:hypothetical protein